GHQTISFELTTANGKRFVLSRGPQGFTKNNPSTSVHPGEREVYAIHLDKSWLTAAAFPKADEMPITLQAVYQMSPTPVATEHKFWAARDECSTYHFTWRQ